MLLFLTGLPTFSPAVEELGASQHAARPFFLNERVMVTGNTAELAGLQGKFGIATAFDNTTGRYEVEVLGLQPQSWSSWLREVLQRYSRGEGLALLEFARRSARPSRRRRQRRTQVMEIHAAHLAHAPETPYQKKKRRSKAREERRKDELRRA